MKKIFYIIVYLVVFAGYSQSEDKIFAEANTFYKENNIERAIGLYLSIEEQGLESAELFFNLGNSYYKQNKVAPAIYYYEKALKLNPHHQDALVNIEFAKRMKIDVIEEL
ncbi:MAG: tetratricopeptide repeat protein, partial [Mycoplasmataceae bacterium]|nr:tetratricopeptide repeat protein [Mycoplasmataceae bacterium]